ncbi:MAG: dihydrofolate reductase, partial [Muribaculaceae bacterium]|nr:dihydrofolate reductase [Muribaculaceae bacterium]
MITIIAAIGRDNAIGRNGDLAFHLRADMRHFKELTTGHTVVMGRKTFDSLPKGALPNRRNIVITRNPDFAAKGTERASSLDEAIAMAAGEEIFIIGGGEIYRQALPLADRMELT